MSRSPLGALRARYAYRPALHRPHHVRNGILLVVVTAFVSYAMVAKDIPFTPGHGRVVRAEFDRASSLRVGYPVRVAGVDVGKVTSIDRRPDGRSALVTMRLDSDKAKGVGTIHADARAGLWWRTLLGRNVYIELDPGSAGAPPLGDATIPRSRTTSQVEIDEVLSTLDPNGRQAMRTMLKEFDTSFARPQDTAAALDAYAPAMRGAAAGLAAMRGTQPGQDLPALVRTTSRALGSLAAHEADLGGLVRNARVTLGVTAARRTDIGALLDRAPSTLREVRAASTRLHATLALLDPVAARLRPGARALAPAAAAATPTLARLEHVLATARPLLTDLRPAMRDLAVASRAGTPLLTGLRPTLQRTRDEIIPWLDRTNELDQKNYASIGPTFAGAESITGQGDVNGHYIRFEPSSGEGALGPAPCHTYLSDPTRSQKIACDEITSVLAELFGAKRRTR